MPTCRAWVMVVSRVADPEKHTPFSAGTEIRRTHPQALEVIGPYDVVVPVEGASLDDVYDATKRIAALPTVASTTVYVSVDPDPRGRGAEASCCILVGALLSDVGKAVVEIRDFPEVVLADLVLGPFDMLVMARIKLTELSGLLRRLIGVRGVVRTVTLYELEEIDHGK